MNDLQRAVAIHVKLLREANGGMTQEQLGSAMKLQRTSISNIEKGKQAISFAQFCMLADIFGENPDVLLKRILADVQARPDVTAKEVKDPKIRNIMNEAISGGE